MQEFWNNVSRFPRYFITVSLGVLWNFIQPLVPLMKRPVTAIALLGILIGGLSFLSFTLRAMLGLSVA